MFYETILQLFMDLAGEKQGWNVHLQVAFISIFFKSQTYINITNNITLFLFNFIIKNIQLLTN